MAEIMENEMEAKPMQGGNMVSGASRMRTGFVILYYHDVRMTNEQYPLLSKN